jgi:hypothetical protein
VRDESILDRLLKNLKAVLRKTAGPEPPEDPYSYVGAPKKPRTPRLSASAKAPLE